MTSDSPQPWIRPRKAAAVVIAVAALLGGIGPTVSAQGPAAGRLRFGIYPGGDVGAIGRTSPAPTGRLSKRLAALYALRGDHDKFVLHIYSSWTGRGSASRARAAALAEVRTYTAAGFEVEPVLRFTPSHDRSLRAVRRYVAHVRRTVRSFARNRRVVSVQIGNEANVIGAASASDGAFRRAKRAIALGVIAAAREARRSRRPGLKVGLNWAAGSNVRPDARFWHDLRRLGGARFARSVSWVGTDVYPDTFSHAGASDPVAVGTVMVDTLKYLRYTALPMAGLDRSVRLHVSENGFPTGATRDEEQQAILLRAAVTAVNNVRGYFGVTDYRWFDLSDAQTGSPDMQHGYGILRDDYSQKPGFAVLADLIRTIGR